MGGGTKQLLEEDCVLAGTQVQVPISLRLSGTAICCESLFREHRNRLQSCCLVGFSSSLSQLLCRFMALFGFLCFLHTKKGHFHAILHDGCFCPGGKKDVSHPHLSNHTKCGKSALGIWVLFTHH